MTDAVHASLALLFAELIDGPAADASYMLNGGDPGLLRSLDRLSAESASKLSPAGGASIAAHVDHLCYGLELMLRWSDGEADPWTVLTGPRAGAVRPSTIGNGRRYAIGCGNSLDGGKMNCGSPARCRR